MTAPSPRTDIGFYWSALKASFTAVSDKNLALVAAGIAFYAMLSIFPALAALIAVLALISDPVFVIAQLDEVRGLLPRDVFDIINGQIVTLVSASTDRLGWAGLISLLVALWSARAGVAAMIVGLNSVYNERNRSFARHYLRALLLTLLLVSVGIVSLLSLVIVPLILAFFPLGFFGTLLVDLLRWATAFVVILVGIGVLYRFGPNRRAARVRWLSLGAVVATLTWGVLSVGFSFYVANFGSYNEVYGSIGAVIAMLVWLWISSFLVLFGAALNNEVELRTHRDSTFGRPKPPGLRGAYAADTIITEE